MDVARVKGGVGLDTPSRTGAIKLSAVSHNSSTDIFKRDWNTRLDFKSGAEVNPLILCQ